jgi:uncharacterized protein
VPDGIVARGTVDARWEGECSTCLRDLSADLTVGVGELFEARPIDGDTYPIEGHEIDLEQLVRDALLLELPLAPVCERDDCAPVAVPGVLVGGPDLAADPTSSDGSSPDDVPADPRWAALSELEL